jgi:hypothetical protein
VGPRQAVLAGYVACRWIYSKKSSECLTCNTSQCHVVRIAASAGSMIYCMQSEHVACSWIYSKTEQ